MPTPRLRSAALACSAGGAVLLASFTARAIDLTLLDKPLHLDITESLYVNAHLDPGTGDASSANYGEYINRLNVQVAWNHFILGVRLDSDAYDPQPKPGSELIDAQCPPLSTLSMPPANCIVAPTQLRVTNPAHPSQYLYRYPTHFFDPEKGVEKIFLTWNSKYVDATAGDSYVSFGRGLILSLRKLDELGVDTTLLGGKVSVHVGDFSATAIAGVTNTQNLDQTTALYTPDANDLILGARADYRIAGKVSVGVEAAGGQQNNANPANPPAPAILADQYAREGIVIDAPRPLPWLSLYGEFVHSMDPRLLNVPNCELPHDKSQPCGLEGNAIYASATAFAGASTFLLEFKDYTNFNVWAASNDRTGAAVYMTPPTLERVQIQLTNNSTVAAGRLRWDYRLSPDLNFYLSPELGKIAEGTPVENTLGDVYAGAEFRWNDGRSHAFPVLEYRREVCPGEICASTPGTNLYEQLIAVEFDGAQAIKGPWSAEFSELIWVRQKPTESTPWEEGNVYVGVKYSPWLEAFAGWEFTTQEEYIKEQHSFFNGSVQWNITPSTSINLFAGGQRGGLRCISGVCRIFPPFQGARLTFVVRG